MHTDTLAVDFGTSNSAVAALDGNAVVRIPIEKYAETLPTAVFFPIDKTPMRIGTAAADALVDGEAGRYMRSLKSVLGLSLLHELRPVGGRQRTIAEINTDFLAELRQRAERTSGQRYRRVLSGRPVRFHSDNTAQDTKAEADLRACYHAAGFEDVAFLAEPEAAAISCGGMGVASATGLIVDIGGGTSDFSVFRNVGGRVEILASHGIRLGGTDFDRAVAMTHAMPELGLGGQLRRDMGEGLLPVPRAPYFELATWATIPFLYNAKTRRMAAGMARLAVEPEKLARFVSVLELELGHELAFAVERGKIAANAGAGSAALDMGFIERGLKATITQDSLNATLGDARSQLSKAIIETLAMAGVRQGDIGRVILVGGSSLMGFVSAEVSALCPDAKILRSEAFTAVVDGLALAINR
ncbi:MAG: Hsp70 family protein [Alphaproteobacteria bacterium]|nr:Hsp70 family protein [Alphaproteobacteria bacterium]